ncbi:MFS transporter [Variovorax sp. PCZ-1]|uniref:MFS transporter n=1 Tax=Variovorax sp. PCZ-1 TaxID=2835533 RepID=UPI001BD0684F|nr:MFS transporter [Variovorax sp. PCZ-1]MBS7807536.1 MFS transporter [Variovorax sp. PCZ-1]
MPKPPIATTRELIPFAALSAAYFSHIGVVNTFLSLWLKEIGYGVALIGLIASIQSFSRLAAPYAWAWLGDRTGQRALMLRIATVLALLGSLGFFWQGGGFWWLIACLLFMYLNSSALMPMSESALAQIVTRGGVFDVRRHGRVRLWGSLGFMVTVLGAGAFFENFGLKYFPIAVTLGLLLLTLSAYSIPDIRENAAHEKSSQPIWHTLRQPAVAWFFGTIALNVLSHMGLYVFFSLYCDELGYSKTMIGTLWAAAVITEIAWFYTQGRWLPRFSLTAWLIIAALASVLRFGLTAGMGDVLWVLFAAQTLHAISFAANHTVCTALISHHFPGNMRGRGQALYTVLGYGIPGVLGSWAGGLISEAYGLRSVFWITTGVAVLATLCAIKVWRLQHPKQATSNH